MAAAARTWSARSPPNPEPSSIVAIQPAQGGQDEAVPDVADVRGPELIWSPTSRGAAAGSARTGR